MSTAQPFDTLVKLFAVDIDHARPRSADARISQELKKLLSRPPAPLATLDQRQRQKIAPENLTKFAGMLEEVRPSWSHDYAAAGIIQLPRRERRLRGLMFRILFAEGTDTAHGLALIAEQIRNLPAPERSQAVGAFLQALVKLPELKSDNFFDELQKGLAALVDAAPPATPMGFAKLATPILCLMARLLPSETIPVQGEARDAMDALLPMFDQPLRMFLMRKRWGSFAPEIGALLWQRLWERCRPAPAEATDRPGRQKELLKEAAWAGADEALARALQDSGRLLRALERLEALASGEVAACAGAAKRSSNLVLQWQRQAATLRNLRAEGEFGATVKFDPAIHESDIAMPGEEVRILKPVILRTDGRHEVVLLRGEVEPE